MPMRPEANSATEIPGVIEPISQDNQSIDGNNALKAGDFKPGSYMNWRRVIFVGLVVLF